MVRKLLNIYVISNDSEKPFQSLRYMLCIFEKFSPVHGNHRVTANNN